MPASLSALNRGRRAANADMRDRCRVTEPSSGEKVWSDELLAYIDAPPRLIYEGKCKLSFGAIVPNERTTADQRFAEQGGTLAVPVVTPAEASGDTAVLNRCREASSASGSPATSSPQVSLGCTS